MCNDEIWKPISIKRVDILDGYDKYDKSLLLKI